MLNITDNSSVSFFKILFHSSLYTCSSFDPKSRFWNSLQIIWHFIDRNARLEKMYPWYTLVHNTPLRSTNSRFSDKTLMRSKTLLAYLHRKEIECFSSCHGRRTKKLLHVPMRKRIPDLRIHARKCSCSEILIVLKHKLDYSALCNFNFVSSSISVELKLVKLSFLSLAGYIWENDVNL